MDQLARMIRLVAGLGMIAAGTSAAVPAALDLHRRWQATAATVSQAPAGAAEPGSPAQAEAEVCSGPEDWSFSGRSVAGIPDGVGPVTLDRDYVLPPPPSPLPPVGSLPPPANAALATAYRSTLEVPPPPLLDGQQPPPLAPGWSGRQPDAGQRPVSPAPQAMVYVIRDGDDLTGIASRFYGHPAAAAAIWEANRGLLADPGILPIGATILLPHPDAMAGLAAVGARGPTIEPAGFSGRVRGIGQTSP